MRPIALIDRVEAPIAGIAHAQPPPANSTDQYTLQQTKSLSDRLSRTWCQCIFAACGVPQTADALRVTPATTVTGQLQTKCIEQSSTDGAATVYDMRVSF